MRRHHEKERYQRQRKKHGGDCGHARCQICHGDKFPRRKPTKAEQIAAIKLKEQS